MREKSKNKYLIQEAVQLNGTLNVLPSGFDPLGEILKSSPERVNFDLIDLEVS